MRRGDRLAIARGRDAAKDQSYVLFPLEQDVLAKARFPLAPFTKPEVREKARAFGLRVAEKPESMEICFVPSGDYRDLVRARAPDAAVAGDIVSESGEVIGRHEGVGFYTIGQRRGPPGGRADPIFVTGIDPGDEHRRRRIARGPSRAHVHDRRRRVLGSRRDLERALAWAP